MSWRIVMVPGFEASIAALGDSPEVSQVVKVLLAQAVNHPYRAPRLDGYEARILKSRSYGNYPALRLLYRVERDVIYLYEIGPHPELGV